MGGMKETANGQGISAAGGRSAPSGVPAGGKRPLWRSLVYGRTVLNILLIAVQLALFALLILRIMPRFVLLGAQYALAAAFLIYLANSKGREEYKLAWMLPILIFPVFGIACYVLVHVQGAPRNVKRRLAAMRSVALTADTHPAQTNKNPYPKIDDISHYLWTQGRHELFTNSDVTYYPSGEAAFPVMLEKLRAAKRFIFVEFFLIKRGWMWSRLLETFIEKAAAGVEVRVMFDALGSVTMPSRATVKRLQDKGIKAIAFSPMTPFFSPYLNNRDHRKIIVVDGEAAFTGGINIGDEYIGRDNRLGTWKDNVALVRGAAVSSFTRMFLSLWDVADENTAQRGGVSRGGEGQHNAAPMRSGDYYSANVRTFVAPGVIIPYCDDAYNGKDIAENVYLYVINNAKKYIHITTPYVALDARIQEALLFAAHSGIEVEMIVPRTIDHYLTYCIGRTYLRTLTAGGVKVYEYTPGFIHAKTIVADGETAVVGTVNFDYRSLFAQFEDALFMHKTPAIYEMNSDFKDTRDECALLTAQSYKKCSIFTRTLGTIGRLFAPLV